MANDTNYIWNNNRVQFARFISELGEISEEDIERLNIQTNLSREEIGEIFRRADYEFEAACERRMQECEDVPLYIMSFRAECPGDVYRLLSSIAVTEVHFKVDQGSPDTEVEITTPLTVYEVRKSMERLDDSHVMSETLRAIPLFKNTLIR